MCARQFDSRNGIRHAELADSVDFMQAWPYPIGSFGRGSKLKNLSKGVMMRLGLKVVRVNSPSSQFHSEHYLCHTARRRERLASPHIPVAGRSLLELGAGFGDHSTYYHDRGCKVTITEAREENLKYLRWRFPGNDVQHLDMDNPKPLPGGPWDVVHRYGLLYHLARSEDAPDFMSRNCTQLPLLETFVSFGAEDRPNLTSEDIRNPTQASSGTGCRPTRTWLHSRVRQNFDYVCTPTNQPNHEEFPVDWTVTTSVHGLSRAIFVASRTLLDNEFLSKELLMQRRRYP